ncbi:DUF2277 domain-containing protein [Microbacterium sp. P02]|uniref:DUF2277 domain-containing protein n=1 Tax=Microbacterium sp. P02 TaxID=3366260 RepID=UPI00366B0600
MCRNIHTLHNFEPAASDDEIQAAALQYVRKIAGTTKPSKANQAAFDHAVAEIAHITGHLLQDLVAVAPPKNREEEAAKARARAEASGRYAPRVGAAVDVAAAS